MTEKGRRDFVLRIYWSGQTRSIKGSVTGRTVSIGALLPTLRAITDTLMEMAAAALAERGRKVSCRAGCGVCCHQSVPISHYEALDLARVIAALPPARRARIERRFADRVRRLAAHGLVRDLRRAHRLNRQQRTRLGLEYFKAKAPCPFLERARCTVRARRPLACREYLVLSHPRFCATLDQKRLEVAPLFNGPASKLFRFADGAGQAPARWLPMILTLESAERSKRHEWESEKKPGPVLLRNFVKKLLGPAARLEWAKQRSAG